jgi:hypothetical protein
VLRPTTGEFPALKLGKLGIKSRKRGLLAVMAAAIAISILLPAQVLAAGPWSAPSTVWAHDDTRESWAFPGGLITLDGSTVVASYVRVIDGDSTEVFVRRSIDSGASWGSPLQVSRTGTGSGRVSMAGYGSNVDVVITESGGATTEPGVQYSRSTDGGSSFSNPVLLSGAGIAYMAHVARGPNGVVAVVWYSKMKSRIYVRVSHDGGVTFAKRVALWQGPAHSTGEQAIAVAEGGIYVASTSLRHGLKLRHSLDGMQWSDQVRLDGYDASGIGDRLSLTADGDEAFIGYVRHNRRGLIPSYRRTTDGALTWSPRSKLSGPVGNVSAPMFSLEDGVARAAFGSSDCPGGPCSLGLFYRQSSDGVAWTPRELVSPPWSLPMGIGYTDRAVIGYTHYESASQAGYDIEVRTATD